MATKQSTEIARLEVEVINDWGLHARPAAAVAMKSAEYESDIEIVKGDNSASAHSIAGLLMLEAVKGTKLTVIANGVDANQAAEAIVDLFAQGFGEEHVVLHGQGSNRGVAIGAAHVLSNSSEDVPHYNIAKASVPAERKRHTEALRVVRRHFKSLKTDKDPRSVGQFQQLLLAMLQEDRIVKQPLRLIEEQLINAEWALKMSVEEIANQFLERDDPVWQARADEYRQVLDRLILALGAGKLRRRRLRHGVKRIVVTDSLGPVDVLDFKKAGYAGFVTSSGSGNSHVAILARGLEIPAILAIDHKAISQIAEDDQLALDSNLSELHIKPDKQTLSGLRKKAVKKRAKPAKAHPSEPVLSKDGIRIHMYANIELPEEVNVAKRSGAEGIGLFRTEFIFLSSAEAPGEDQQYEYYREVIEHLDGLPAVFRTLDIGHDKVNDNFGDVSPLGLRGVRMVEHEVALMKIQLRAMLRASVHGPMEIMLPMVSQAAEVEACRQLLTDCAGELGMSDSQIPRLGAMIEIPGTAYILKELSKVCDFFSIGSNDLIQYVLAVDRNNSELAELALPTHPGVIALLNQIIRVSTSLRKPLTMCGELAADPTMVRLCCSLGLRNLSMMPNKLAEIREVIANLNITGKSMIAEEIVSCGSVQKVGWLLEDLNT